MKNTGNLISGASGYYSYAGNGTAYTINSGPDGSDFDTYLKWNSQPATDDYDARGYTGWPQDIAGPAAGAGTEHYMVHAYTGSGEYATTTMIY